MHYLFSFITLAYIVASLRHKIYIAEKQRDHLLGQLINQQSTPSQPSEPTQPTQPRKIGEGWGDRL